MKTTEMLAIFWRLQNATIVQRFSGAICGVIYHLFAGQPLTIIGSTGPVLVFETIVFDMCQRLAIRYLSFRFWVSKYDFKSIFFTNLLIVTFYNEKINFLRKMMFGDEIILI